MTATYDCIATTTLGSAQASVTFSSISGSYTDIVAILSTQCNRVGSDDYMKCNVNSDTGSNYSYTVVYGNGSSAGSFRESNKTYMEFGIVPNADEFGVRIINFMNYSNTTTNKTTIDRYNLSDNQVGSNVNLWRSTSAINSISFALINGSSFVSGSSFSLYGIKSE